MQIPLFTISSCGFAHHDIVNLLIHSDEGNMTSVMFEA
ncbi:hypothetical protein B4123_0430 [Bacillus paralicheniformis]|nr:hypothetical protein B4123_0430 [Bacillus paralicheniformis]TWJ52245.1 hypothetical protein CHCC5023_4366 [Bacillus paralicheniformis]TWJ70813.1 hypothetical protein CHCC5019_3874 [Bacillus paralicheniformis]TWN86651.1 hypothetical protein CHCC20490_4186 [Bacillus paralicheniformis]